MFIKKRGIHLLVIALAVVGAGLFNIATSYTTVSAAPDAAWCKANVSASAPESRKDDADFKAHECASVCRFTPAINDSYRNFSAPSKWTCQDASSETTPIANACSDYAAGSDERTACEAGFTNNGNAEYCSKTYPVNAPSDQEKRTACEKGAVAAGVKLPTPPAPPGEAARKPTCSGGAIGWLLCPVVNLMQIANDMMAPQIENQLTIPPLMSGTATYLGTFKIWQMMVGIGNLILILGFLIVIFSQATSMGISAYGVKKLMPRIIAAAILINLSYFICAIAIDITNVIGASVKGIIGVGLDQVRITGNATPSFGEGAGAIMLAIVGVGALLVTGAVAYLVPALVMVVMSLMVVFLGLALRKVIIILLIVIAPLAFAAMILPGTEGLFKKWQKTFINLLVMYPVIMALLYGSMLVSNIILATDSNAVQMINAGGNPEADGMTAGIAGAGIVNVLLAYAVLGLGPAIGSYMYIKSSNKLFAMAANAVNKASSGARKWANSVAGDSYKRSKFGVMREQAKGFKDQAARERAFAKRGVGGALGSVAAGVMPGSRAARRMNTYVAGQNEKLYDQDVAAETERLARSSAGQNLTAAEDHVRQLARSGTATKAEMQASVANLLSHKGGKSTLRTLFNDQGFMSDVNKSNDAWDGLARGAVTNKGFADAHADIANAIMQHESAFRTATTQASGQTENITDSAGNVVGSRSISQGEAQFLGANFDRNNPNSVANGVKSWSWIAERPSQILATSHDHTQYLDKYISYDTAKATRDSQDFGNSDPGIQSMINRIISDHESGVSTRSGQMPSGGWSTPQSGGGTPPPNPGGGGGGGGTPPPNPGGGGTP